MAHPIDNWGLQNKSNDISAASHLIILVFTALVISITYAFGYKQNKLILDNLKRTEYL